MTLVRSRKILRRKDGDNDEIKGHATVVTRYLQGISKLMATFVVSCVRRLQADDSIGHVILVYYTM